MLCRTQLRPYFTDVLCHEYRRTRLITLNAPKKHNALSLDMVKMLHALYITEPAADDAMYVIKGAGPKSFCAGGDVVALITAHDTSSSSSSNNLARDYFYLEYQVNHRIFTMPQPHVALMHGYVLGGGAGISIPGSLRVATESAIFAMPEMRIGGVPDVGASFFLPRLPVDGLGLLLGLSGHRLRGADVLHAGLATHMANNLMLPQMERELCHVSSREEMMAVVEHHHHRCGTLPDFSLAPYTDWIRRTFSLDANNNVAAIVASVEEEASAHPNDVFLNQLRQALAGASPTTLRLTLELFRRGAAAQTPAEALMHEYAVSQHLLTHHDFTEGVRALLIDKDQHPQWCPATLEEVSDASIDAYFAAPTTPWHPTQPLPSF